MHIYQVKRYAKKEKTHPCPPCLGREFSTVFTFLHTLCAIELPPYAGRVGVGLLSPSLCREGWGGSPDWWVSFYIECGTISTFLICLLRQRWRIAQRARSINKMTVMFRYLFRYQFSTIYNMSKAMMDTNTQRIFIPIRSSL